MDVSSVRRTLRLQDLYSSRTAEFPHWHCEVRNFLNEKPSQGWMYGNCLALCLLDLLPLKCVRFFSLGLCKGQSLNSFQCLKSLYVNAFASPQIQNQPPDANRVYGKIYNIDCKLDLCQRLNRHAQQFDSAHQSIKSVIKPYVIQTIQ